MINNKVVHDLKVSLQKLLTALVQESLSLVFTMQLVEALDVLGRKNS